jgi:hypothetical protein
LQFPTKVRTDGQSPAYGRTSKTSPAKLVEHDHEDEKEEEEEAVAADLMLDWSPRRPRA